MKAEHAALHERLSKLNRAISQLIVQQKWLRYALQRANEERPALESIVEKYQSKLNDEVDGTGVVQLPPSIDSTNRQVETPLVPPSQVATQPDPALKPTLTLRRTFQTRSPVLHGWGPGEREGWEAQSILERTRRTNTPNSLHEHCFTVRVLRARRAPGRSFPMLIHFVWSG